jgi:hypothetical protein
VNVLPSPGTSTVHVPLPKKEDMHGHFLSGSALTTKCPLYTFCGILHIIRRYSQIVLLCVLQQVELPEQVLNTSKRGKKRRAEREEGTRYSTDYLYRNQYNNQPCISTRDKYCHLSRRYLFSVHSTCTGNKNSSIIDVFLSTEKK